MTQTNLFFLSGPHGSGKTTLGEELAKSNPRIMIPELYSRNVKFNISDEIYRQVLKVCSRAIENFEYLKIARENPDKIVLGNRCVYDIIAYDWAYFSRGWIPIEVYERYDQYASDFFSGENSSPYAIVLNPDFAAIKRHLEKRWRDKGKKWREEDMDYAKFAHEAYRRFRNLENVLYLDHEIDLRDRREINGINDWVKERAGVSAEILAIAGAE